MTHSKGKMSSPTTMEEAMEAFLSAAGFDMDDPLLVKTPRRFAKAFEEMTSGYHTDPRKHLRVTFTTDTEGPVQQLVSVRRIEFRSLCEHHLLPFFGHVDVVFRPKTDIVPGLSKIGRAIDALAHRLQMQERIGTQLAEAMQSTVSAGVLVRIRAKHTCMLRGVVKHQAETTTLAVLGFDVDDRKLALQLLED